MYCIVCMNVCIVCSKQQVQRLDEMKQKRDASQVKMALDALSESAKRSVHTYMHTYMHTFI